MVWSRYSGPSLNLLSNKFPKFTSVMPRPAGIYPWGTRRAGKPELGQIVAMWWLWISIHFQSNLNHGTKFPNWFLGYAKWSHGISLHKYRIIPTAGTEFDHGDYFMVTDYERYGFTYVNR